MLPWALADARHAAGCHSCDFPIYSSRSPYDLGIVPVPVLHCDLPQGRDGAFRVPSASGSSQQVVIGAK